MKQGTQRKDLYVQVNYGEEVRGWGGNRGWRGGVFGKGVCAATGGSETIGPRPLYFHALCSLGVYMVNQGYQFRAGGEERGHVRSRKGG